jgi:hypothetical protein
MKLPFNAQPLTRLLLKQRSYRPKQHSYQILRQEAGKPYIFTDFIILKSNNL